MKYLFLIALSLSTFILFSQYDIEKAKKEQEEKEGESGADLFAVKISQYGGEVITKSTESLGNILGISKIVLL